MRYLASGGWWFKKRDTHEEKQRDGGEERGRFFFFMREGESCIGIYYIILVGNIYNFNEKNGKIKVGMSGIL